jgi:hypothetical protein
MILNLSSALVNSSINYSSIYEKMLLQLGSTYFTDISFLIASFVCLIGIGFNLMGIRVLFNGEFNSIRLFDYMKVYLINSAIMCALLLPSFTIAKRFVFADKIYGSFYGCFIYGPLINGCYTFSSIIDITITLDRISIFTKKFDFVKKCSLTSICVMSIVCCVLINVPFYFIYYPDSFEVYLNETLLFNIYYMRPTQFAESKHGSILRYILFLLRDVVPVLFLISLNAISIYLFKRYIMHRSKLFSIRDVDNKTSNQLRNKSGANENTHPSQSLEAAAAAAARATIATCEMRALNLKQGSTQQGESNRGSRNNSKKCFTRADRSATWMAIVLSIMSIIKHSLVILTNIFVGLSEYIIGYQFSALVMIAFTISFLLKFFVFYLFNSNFRNAINKTYHFNKL